MAGVFVLRSNFAGTAWKSAFAERLIALCPDINPDAADELADRAMQQLRHLEPAAAADRWHRMQPACNGVGAQPLAAAAAGRRRG